MPADHRVAAAVMQHGQDVAPVLAQVGLEAAAGARVTTVELRAALRRLSEQLGHDPEVLTDGDMKKLVGAMRNRFGVERHKNCGAPYYVGARLKPGFGGEAANLPGIDEELGL